MNEESTTVAGDYYLSTFYMGKLSLGVNERCNRDGNTIKFGHLTLSVSALLVLSCISHSVFTILIAFSSLLPPFLPSDQDVIQSNYYLQTMKLWMLCGKKERRVKLR